MKIGILTRFLCFFIALGFSSIKTFAEDIPSSPDESQTKTPTQNDSLTNHDNASSNKPVDPENNKNQTPDSQPKPKNETEVKPKQPPKKIKKASPPPENTDEPSKHSNPPVTVKLPDISDEEIPENNIKSVASSNSTSDKIIKGIISWIMILSGLFLILWVILKNRKITANSNIANKNHPKNGKSKHKIYYTGLHRK